MAKVRVKKGKLWDRGSMGLWTPGMEATIPDEQLMGGSALNEIVEIIQLGHQVEPVVSPVQATEDLSGEEILPTGEIKEETGEDEEVNEEEEPVNEGAPPISTMSKLLGTKAKVKKVK